MCLNPCEVEQPCRNIGGKGGRRAEASDPEAGDGLWVKVEFRTKPEPVGLLFV